MLTKKCLACGKKFTKPKSCSLAEWNGSKRRPKGMLYHNRECADKSKKGFSFSPSTQFGNREYTPWLKGTKGIAKTNSGSFKKGNKLSQNTKDKMKGRVPWNKGIVWEEMRRENHPNFKGNADIKTRLRACPEYTEWIKKVLKRDNYKCVECSKNNNRLHIHHVIPFYKIIDDNNIKTYKQGQDCKLLWDIKNGKTLCISCHKQTDSYKENQHTLKKPVL